jgi:hypothetical protein
MPCSSARLLSSVHEDSGCVCSFAPGSSSNNWRDLCRITDVSGFTVAQTLDTARQADMPARAIESECIDFVLSRKGVGKLRALLPNERREFALAAKRCPRANLIRFDVTHSAAPVMYPSAQTRWCRRGMIHLDVRVCVTSTLRTSDSAPLAEVSVR